MEIGKGAGLPAPQISRLLPVHVHAVAQHRRAVLVYRHLELRGECGCLGPFVRRAEDLPVAADRLVHFHGDRHGLVIAQRDLVLHFVGIAAERPVIGLLALGDHVKGVAGVQADLFVFRRVADAVFPGEERLAVRIGLIDAHRSRRQGHPQIRFLGVLEFVVDLAPDP